MAMKERGDVVVVSSGVAGGLDGQATARHLPSILVITWGIVTAGAAISDHAGLWLTGKFYMGGAQVAIRKAYPFDMPTRATCYPVKLRSHVEVLTGEDILVVFALTEFPSGYSVGVSHSCAFGPFIVFVLVVEPGAFIFGDMAADG